MVYKRILRGALNIVIVIGIMGNLTGIASTNNDKNKEPSDYENIFQEACQHRGAGVKTAMPYKFIDGLVKEHKIDIKAVPFMLGKLDDKKLSSYPRAVAAGFLGFLKDPSAIEPMTKIFKDEVSLRKYLADAFRFMNDIRVVPALIEGLEDEQKGSKK